MPSRRLIAIALPLLVLTGACGDDSGPTSGASPDAPADDPASDPTTEPNTPTATPPAAPQEVVDAAVLTADEVGMPVYGGEESSTGSDLETSTFEYCSHGETGNGESLRLARSQGWWADELFTADMPGGVEVGNEAVLYDEGGAEAFMTGFAAVPDACPRDVWDWSNGVAFDYAAEPAPPGLPEGAAAIHVVRTQSSGQVDEGYAIALRKDDLVSILYINATSSAQADEVAPPLIRAALAKLDAAPQ